jgi:hypothetical protein
MVKFFFELTKNNWGFPWHILLAYMGVDIFEKLFPLFLKIEVDTLWTSILGALVINAIGYIYELIQGKNKDTKQDLIANLSGSIIGTIL